MKKYIGQYRVICERDDHGNITDKDNLYIPCKVGKQVYRYGDDVLAYEGTNKTCRKIIAQIPEAEFIIECATEALIKFPESKLNIVDGIVRLATYGKSISPWSEKHYNPFYVKPEYTQEQLDAMRERITKARSCKKKQ